ncbi:ATP-dependent nuclease [Actinoplanes derwentensis]|uniref:Predicted ATP-dependent endonuclease of the OLD family, contains P-loop ATPase and TOPRIM domains n=1 Tax=Actinoplanes derwentensis TaxID=113562 RepID=A0A1H2DCM9_9ACTN|nr:ATP-binding protein [Actinoplanes derwentensis]GID89549.1 hypothetical protein Ade03nite_84730 [Actinoplanes derwentensis]SDT80493.1 Predicted ATP-dependent endonuclease of the OLD family, contains P-loop ATPase and TOPRIM domains [Actinoplanes derwentensis]
MQIRRVIARNFRGSQHADWTLPQQRFLCLVGAGDSTKTTLLDAIALVLTPRWGVQFTDADFHAGNLAEPIVLQLVVGDLDGTMLADSLFGLDLCGLTGDGQLVHDPVDGAEPCVMLQLRVDEELEPEWTVVRPGSVEPGQPVSAAKRKALGLFRIDDRVDTHLRWGRGSALSRMTDAGGSGRAVTLASRAARDAIFNGPQTELHAVAGRVAAAVSEIGGRAYTGLQPGLDPQGASSTSALLLHDDRIPLTSAGLGTRRLTSIAVQEIAAVGGDIVIIDEIEHGLEPHRLLHVLHRLKRKAVDESGQVIITTHSPIAVQALQAQDIFVVRSAAGETTVSQVPADVEEAQGALRACPAAVLARKVVVGEGKTEVGLARHLIRSWDAEQIAAGRPTHAALGAALVDGVGKTAPVRSKIFQSLDITALLLVDNDDRNVDDDIQAAMKAGVTVVRWQENNSTEAEIISTLDVKALTDLLQFAVQIHDEQVIRDAVVARLKNVASPGLLDPDSWLTAGHTLDEIRHAVAEAAKKKEWFKREDRGELLGAFILAHWGHYKDVVLGRRLAELRRFIYEA